MPVTTTIITPNTLMLRSDDRVPSEQMAKSERYKERRRRRRAKKKARLAAEQEAASGENGIGQPLNAAKACPSPTPSPAAQLRAELISSTLQQDIGAADASEHVCSCGTPSKPEPADVSISGHAISAAIIRLNNGVSGLINAFSPSISRQDSTGTTPLRDTPLVSEILKSEDTTLIEVPPKAAKTPLYTSNSTKIKKESSGKRPPPSRAKYTPEERQRRRNNRRLVREYGYDMSEDDLDDLFPSRRRKRDDFDFDDNLPASFWTGGDEKFEYTMSFINGCRF